MSIMRTTVTLDDDVYQALERHSRKTDQPFKKVLNDTIRSGLGLAGRPRKPDRQYRATVFDRALRPGIDPLHLNRLADDLEIEHFAETLRRQRQ